MLPPSRVAVIRSTVAAPGAAAPAGKRTKTVAEPPGAMVPSTGNGLVVAMEPSRTLVSCTLVAGVPPLLVTVMSSSKSLGRRAVVRFR